MRIRPALLLALTVFLCQFAPVTAHAEPVDTLPVTQQRLDQHLTPDQIDAALTTLANAEQGTLGPQPLDEADAARIAGPERRIDLDAAAFADEHDIAGDGSEADPFRGLLSAYASQLDERDVAVVVPAGHYQDIGIDVPERVWFIAEGDTGDVVVRAPGERDDETAGHVFSLVSGGGLVGFEIDGSATPFTRAPGEWRGREYMIPESDSLVHGVVARRRGGRGDRESDVVIAHNHIHHCTGDGIRDETYRRRWGTRDVLASDNLIEYIGYRGIGGGAGWRIQNNIVRYAGILHPSSGGGQDGIILGWINYHDGGQGDSEVIDNIVVSSRRFTGNARHGIATHVGHEILFAGNLVILEGRVRGGLRYSDWSHGNRIIGNVVVGIELPEDDGRLTRDAIGISGQGNEVIGNATFGTQFFINLNNMPADDLRRTDTDPGDNVLRDNYAEAAADNAISQLRGPDRNVSSGNEFHGIRAMPAAGELIEHELPALWYGDDGQ